MVKKDGHGLFNLILIKHACEIKKLLPDIAMGITHNNIKSYMSKIMLEHMRINCRAMVIRSATTRLFLFHVFIKLHMLTHGHKAGK